MPAQVAAQSISLQAIVPFLVSIPQQCPGVSLFVLATESLGSVAFGAFYINPRSERCWRSISWLSAGLGEVANHNRNHLIPGKGTSDGDNNHKPVTITTTLGYRMIQRGPCRVRAASCERWPYASCVYRGSSDMRGS